MRDLKIGRILLEHRRKRGVTQDELAEYIGVSKAAVSKWETAATYPDITLLPQLAAFFNISIDQLIGYEPQMTRRDIRQLCRTLARDFSCKPFEQVMDCCRDYARKYFSCPELLFQLGGLYINHCMLAGAPEKGAAILEEAITLFQRVREESDDSSLAGQAAKMEGICLLQLGRSQEVIELLEHSVPLRLPPEPLLAQAYLAAGQPLEAKRILQAGMYQIAVELLNLQLPYLDLCQEDPAAFQETIRRILALAESFRLETLHPAMLLTVYLTLAQGYMKHGDQEPALDLLEKYQKLALSDIYPLRLQGDSYFSLLNDWLEDVLPLGSQLPREESAVRKNILEAPDCLPEFACLKENPRFQAVLHNLQKHGGNL